MSHYIIELRSVGLRPRYLKAQQARRIISTRYESNARKFTTQSDALIWTAEHGCNYGWTTTVKQVEGKK
jgi:hypothetical protein